MKTVCIALLVATTFLTTGCASSNSKYFGISRGEVPTPEQWIGLYGIVLGASSIAIAALTASTAAPPYSSGTSSPSRPRGPIFRIASQLNDASSST